MSRETRPAAPPPAPGWLARAFDSDVSASFRASKVAMAAALVTALLLLGALFAPLISPQDPFDPAQLELINSRIPPLWMADGQAPFLLGTDDQGRDILSAILYGLRVSLMVGFAGVVLAAILGIAAGLVAGYAGGSVDALIMRIADVQLTFPAILIALLVDGIVKSVFGARITTTAVLGVLVFSIGLAFWVQYARTVRGSVMVEKGKDYVQAGRLIGLSSATILTRHILPNVIGPVFAIATINVALAVITEATLSFLGSGLPDTQPSLGTLIRIGNRYLFSGEWWIAAFPGVTLVVLVLAVNLLGDWLRDALNPRLQ